MKRIPTCSFYLLCIFGFWSSGCHRLPNTEVVSPYESKVISSNLSNQSITCFAEDAEGYIWIGTESGLNRYDGREYVQYYHTEDSTSINMNRIKTLFIASDSTLWVGTASGINSLDEKDCFQHYELPSNSKLLNGIYEYEGELYATTLGCLLKYNNKNDSFEKCIDLHSSTQIIHVTFFEQTVFLILPRRILNYNMVTGELIRQLDFEEGSFVAASDIQHNTYLATQKQLFRLIKQSGEVIPLFDQSFADIRTIISEMNRPEGLFIADANSLYHFDNGHSAMQLTEIEDASYSHGDIATVFIDSNRNIWLGYDNYGYSVIYSYEKDFYENHFRLKRNLAGSNITSVAGDSHGRIWFVVNHSNLLVQDNGVLQTIDLDAAFHRRISNFANILNLYVDQDDTIWMNIDYTLNKCEYDGNSFHVKEQYPLMGTLERIANINDPVIYSLVMTTDLQGVLWIGWLNGNIYYLEPGQNTISFITIPEPELTHMGNITTLMNGDILCGFHARSLYIVDPVNKRIKEEIIIPEINEDHLYITSVSEDMRGYLWVGTRGTGIFRVDPNYENYINLQSIPCRDVNAIVNDKNGDVWISSFNGLYKYNLETGTVNTYHTADGIGGEQFNYNSATTLQEGEVLFGGTHGITILDPEEIRQPVHGGKLHFDELFVNNILIQPTPGGILEKRLSKTTDIWLNHRQRNISFSFSIQDFGRQYQILYRYTLQGIQKNNWINLGNVHSVSWDKIPYGNHVLTVESNYQGDPDTRQTIQMRLHVRRPPWTSIFALIMYALCFLAIIAEMIHLAMNLYRSRLDRLTLEKANEMDMRFFSNVSHEFRTPLTMVNGALRQLRSEESPANRKRYYEIITRNTDRMIRLVDQIMDFNKIEADVLRLSVVQTDALSCIRNTVDNFSFGFLQKHVILHIQCDMDEIPMWLDEDKMDKILSNLFSNALKFTPSGNGVINLDISRIPAVEAQAFFPGKALSEQTPFLLIRVFNSGSHIPSNKLDYIFGRYNQLEEGSQLGGTGVGLYYTHRLIEIHHGAIKAENIQEPTGEEGVVFSFVLPIGEEAYSYEERQNHKLFSPSFKTERQYISEEPKSAENENKPLILVIDDDYEITFYLKSLLSPFYRIRIEQDGSTGYKTLGEINPDLVLCDVLMPNIDGIQLCRMAKANLAVCHIPFILLTAKYSIDDQVLGLDSGANAYVVKPFDPDYLLAVIKSQLQNRELMRQRLTHHTSEKEIEESLENELDKHFIRELYKLMEKTLDQPDMNITDMCKAIGVSRTQLFQKVKALTGETPHAFFIHYKMNIAAKWILEGQYKFSAIAEDLGFSSASHFTSVFKKEFGCLPSEYKSNHSPA